MTNKNNTTKGKTMTGTVVSDKMKNTIVVSLDYRHQHPLYKKTVKTRTRIYSENNMKAKVGDLVLVRECRPLSKTKRFTTLEIIKSN